MATTAFTTPALTPLARAIVLLRAARDATIEVLEMDVGELPDDQADDIDNTRDYLRAAYHPLALAMSVYLGRTTEAVLPWHRAEVVANDPDEVPDDVLASLVRRLRNAGQAIPKDLDDRVRAHLSAIA
jgi:hypothetical protein